MITENHVSYTRHDDDETFGLTTKSADVRLISDSSPIQFIATSFAINQLGTEPFPSFKISSF